MANLLKKAVALAVLVVAGGTWWFFSTGDAEPTTDVTAPPIETTTTAPPEGGDSGDETTTAPTTTEAGGARTFELTDESTATFELDEELRGQPKHVVGTSDIVVGQLRVDRDDLAGTEIGTILVNARAFQTDSSFRDRAVRGPILDTEAHEFIEFVPTSIVGLAGSAAVGDTLEFAVTGDLTIRDVTREGTFEVTATLTSPDRIEGTATTTVLRSDYELQIPSVAAVANVTDEVTLTLDFAAEAS